MDQPEDHLDASPAAWAELLARVKVHVAGWASISKRVGPAYPARVGAVVGAKASWEAALAVEKRLTEIVETGRKGDTSFATWAATLSELDALQALAAQAIDDRLATRETQAAVTAWGDSVFGPIASTARAAARANEEMAELLRALTENPDHPKAGEEMADVVIVLYRLATRMGVDLHEEIDRKMTRNRARVWKTDGTGHGYHVPASGGS